MKSIQFLIAAAFAGVMALTSTATAQQQSTGPGCATVVRTEGKIEYTLGDNKWHPLIPGKVLPPGSTIRSLDNGTADVVLGKKIEFPQAKATPGRIGPNTDAKVTGYTPYIPAAEQNTIRVTEDTIVSIDKLMITDTGSDSVSDTELNLKKGTIHCSVKKLTPTSKYFIKIPKGMAGVRGTKFSISAEGKVSCYESSSGGVTLAFPGADGKTFTPTVAPGNSFDPATGQSSPLSSGDMSNLKRIFAALSTHYVVLQDYYFDRTSCHVSPTTGNRGQGNAYGHEKHWWIWW